MQGRVVQNAAVVSVQYRLLCDSLTTQINLRVSRYAVLTTVEPGNVVEDGDALLRVGSFDEEVPDRRLGDESDVQHTSDQSRKVVYLQRLLIAVACEDDSTHEAHGYGVEAADDGQSEHFAVVWNQLRQLHEARGHLHMEPTDDGIT